MNEKQSPSFLADVRMGEQKIPLKFSLNAKGKIQRLSFSEKSTASLGELPDMIKSLIHLIEQSFDKLINYSELEELLDFSSMSKLQSEVFPLLMLVPPGKVTTYGYLAHAIGFPNKARPIGQAMAKNPFSLIIPCHRVIPSNHTVGNYGGNSRLKEALLRFEGTQILDIDGTPVVQEESIYFFSG